MQFCSDKDIKIMTGVLAASLLLGGCSAVKPSNSAEPLTNDPSIKAEINFRDVSKTDYDQDLMDKEYRRYCFELFSQSVRDYGTDKNIMISPGVLSLKSVTVYSERNVS